MELSELIKSFTVPKNTYSLTSSDIDWLYSHLEYSSPGALLKGLLKRRFDNPLQQFPTEVDRAKASLEIIRANPHDFDTNEIDKTLRDTFLNSDVMKPRIVFRKFRELLRGFTDLEWKNAEKGIKTDKRSFLKKIGSIILENDCLQRKSARHRAYKREAVYKQNAVDLHKIYDSTEKVFSNIHHCAYLKCSATVNARRNTLHYKLFRLNASDYLGLDARLEWLDPKRIDFPLRYAMFLSHVLYEHLLNQWKAGTPKGKLLEYFENTFEPKEEHFKKVLEDCVQLGHIFTVPRKQIIEELRDCLIAKRYSASTIIAITQTEGLIWDLAKALHKRHKWVFSKVVVQRNKTQYFARTLSGKEKRLISARDLIETPRFKKYFLKYVSNYLIDEFYDERNDWAHGNMVGNRSTAVNSLMCLITVVDMVLECVKKEHL